MTTIILINITIGGLFLLFMVSQFISDYLVKKDQNTKSMIKNVDGILKFIFYIAGIIFSLATFAISICYLHNIAIC